MAIIFIMYFFSHVKTCHLYQKCHLIATYLMYYHTRVVIKGLLFNCFFYVSGPFEVFYYSTCTHRELLATIL